MPSSHLKLAALVSGSGTTLQNFIDVIAAGELDAPAAFSRQVFSLCDDARVDLICLAGWLCLLDLPERYAGRVMNIHPALLPSFGGRGMYGKKVHQAVLDHG